ncbi:MAG: GNAT family N-acetyltransferase [Clostridiales bacterium]|nr:GNAT family N-acetyltransferase [Clostridiales bacterium]
MIELKRMTENEAINICDWQYEGEFKVYNFPKWDEAVEKGYGITKDNKRNLEFLSIYSGSQLIGYGRISLNNNQIVLGIGIKPELCSKGYGNKAFKLLIEKARTKSSKENIVLLVRSFNERAIKCYKNNNFIIINKFQYEMHGESVSFTKMLYVNR